MSKIISGSYDTYFIILLTFVLRYFQIFSVEYPNGWDGCFYEMQLDTWLETGSMHSPNFSLIYLLLKPIAWITSPAIAYKIVTVLGSVLFSVFIALYIRRKVGRMESIVIWLLSLSSPLLLFTSHQFTKNLLGLDVLLLYFISDKKWWKTVLILVLSFFTHRVAFGIVSIIIAWDLIRLLSKRKLMYLFFAGGIGIIALSFLPGLPNPFDYLRIVKEIKLAAVWSPVAFYNVWTLESFGFIWYLETILFHAILFISIFFIWKQKDDLALLFTVILFLLPIYEFSTGSLGYRLYINAFCLVFLLSPYIFKLSYAKQVLSAVAIISLPFSVFSYDPLKFDPPVDSYKNIVDKVNQVLETTDPVSLIIAHKGIKEQIILRTKYDALNWRLDDSITDTNCYRIVYGITDQEIIELQGNAQSEWKKLARSYYITRELNWKQFLKALEEEGRYSRIEELKTWLNPYETRPAYFR